MAGSINKIILVGHLGAKPVARSFPDGTKHTQVSLATTDVWKDKETGEKKTRTDWHFIVFVGRLAELACEFLEKGSLIYVEGSSRSRSYRPTGADHDTYVTEVHAQVMRMLDRKVDQTPPIASPNYVPPVIGKEDVPTAGDDGVE